MAALTDDEIQDAMQRCADEPVHIPGIVQPFGCLIACHAQSGEIAYVSENTTGYLGVSAKTLLGTPAPDALGREAWHAVRNAVSRARIAQEAISIGDHDIGGQSFSLQVHKSGDYHVIELEQAQESGLDGSNAMKTLGYLMAQIQTCETEQALFELTCALLRHMTGYDRVLIYRFDSEFNGEVLAEDKQGPIESFLGLRFPHWDIPKQARAIMSKIPLRFIQDVDQVPVPILAEAGAGPLDITLANTRGVSTVHMEYLRNMGTAATMTLSVVVEEKLWGIISFHHRRPRVPAPVLRELLVNFLQVFTAKLLTLRQQSALKKIEMLDQGFVAQTDEQQSIEAMLPSSAPLVLDALEAHGIALYSGTSIVSFGDNPDQDVLRALADLALTSSGVVAIDALAERFPEHADKLGKAGGALVVGVLPERAVCVFRNEVARETAWAGNPEKTIELQEGRLRLAPRGSFSVYMEMVKGRCERWSEDDIYLVRHLRTLLHATERQTMMDTLNRQQELMIGELNHRVRNILALVRSVSRQARRRYGSLNSYANAIENRIRALAAAHDISGGSSTEPVSLHALIQLEFEPFRTVADQQARIVGIDQRLRPEIAPIFSLVVHELTTNAAKYGALSAAGGRITVSIEPFGDDISVHWQETGGPKVTEPNEHGFGMAMIEQAVPHELGGTAEVRFGPDGLDAMFVLPGRHFVNEAGGSIAIAPAPRAIEPEEIKDLPAHLREGTVMVLEDNFIIAKEMADHLRDIGCVDVRTASSVETALDVVQSGLSFAVLDVNLGADKTSEPVALRLTELGVPFVFVTGYGEDIAMSPALAVAPRLTKPISTTEFLQAVDTMAKD